MCVVHGGQLKYTGGDVCRGLHWPRRCVKASRAKIWSWGFYRGIYTSAGYGDRVVLMDKYAMVYTGLGGCVKASCTGERGKRENLMCMEDVHGGCMVYIIVL